MLFVLHLFYFFPQGDRGESGLPGDKGEKGEKVQEVIISCSCPTLFPHACDWLQYSFFIIIYVLAVVFQSVTCCYRVSEA